MDTLYIQVIFRLILEDIFKLKQLVCSHKDSIKYQRKLITLDMVIPFLNDVISMLNHVSRLFDVLILYVNLGI
jgi:hypothetical protein